MNPVTGRKIEVFEPFGAAFELTKLILFQPFDIGKWFTIGFAAFLAFLGGGGSSFNTSRRFKGGDWNWKMRSSSHDMFGASHGMPAWVIPLITIGAVVVLVIVVVLIWLGARGKFMFTDCIVRNRGAIVEPWNEFKKEGNSYFLFRLLIGACSLGIIVLATIPFWLPVLFGNQPGGGPLFVVLLICLGLIFILFAVFIGLVSNFMIPVMYRRRCGATEAFRAALAAITANAGPVILYFLFVIVLWLAVASVACLSACVTCCVTAIPYIGTVILLPLYVFMMSYMLLFVRQFGNDFDAWANILAVAPAVPSIEPPEPELPPTTPPPIS